MSDVLHSETVTHDGRSYTIKVYHDNDVTSPLDLDEGVKITCNAEARSQYGNEPLSSHQHRRIEERIALWGSKAKQFAEALREGDPFHEPLGEPLIGLPVYVYQHGSIAMRTTPFTCPWDSGQSGFVYVTRKTALDWQGGKRLTKRKVERVLASLAGIVEEYGRWINGETYLYVIEDEDGENVASCGGYIGMDYMLDEAKREAHAVHQHVVRQEAKERAERQAWEARGVVTVPA
jgi:hypothetical protein